MNRIHTNADGTTRPFTDEENAEMDKLVAKTREMVLNDRVVFTRLKRNEHLTQSDWTQISDAPLTTEQRAAWAVYRQALRNVPAQPEFPDNVVWPTPPQ